MRALPLALLAAAAAAVALLLAGSGPAPRAAGTVAPEPPRPGSAPAPPAARSLEVLVVDAGRAVPGVAVALLGGPGEAVTDARGIARIGGVAAGSHAVVARAADGRVGSGEAEPGVLAVVHLLPGGGELRGTVVHSDGRPFRGRVRVPGHSPGWTELDAEGRFALDGLPKGAVTLECSGDGVRYVDSPVHVPVDGEYRLVVDADTRPIRGVVLDWETDGAVAGAVVSFEQSRLRAETEADADGRYELRAPHGLREITIRAKGYATARPHEYEGLPPELITRLFRPGVVEGRVVDEAGAPVAGARVVLRAGDDLAERPADGAGRFRFEDVTPGEVLLDASGDVPGTVRARPVDGRSVFVRSGGTHRVELTLADAATIEGRVLEDDGRPAAGALVKGVPADADGRVAVPVRGAPPWTVAVETPGRPSVAFDVEDGFEVRLPPGAWRPVQVVSRGGPVAGARVAVVRRNARIGLPSVTGADGRVQVPDDAEEIVVEARGFLRLRTPPAETVTLVPGRTLRVHVAFPDGRPAHGADVVGSLPGDRYSDQVRATTALDGCAVLEPLAEGDATVEAFVERDPVRWNATGTTPGGELRLVLASRIVEPGAAPAEDAAFELRIVDREGRPVPHGYVYCESEEEGEIVLDPEPPIGTFEFTDGRWTGDPRARVLDVIRASTPTDGPLPLGAVLLGRVTGTGRHVVEMPPEERLAGRVTDPDGGPVAGVLVWAFPAGRVPARRPFGHERHEPYLDRTRTDHEGRFELGRLPRGEIGVVVDHPGDLLPSGRVLATAPGEPVTIVLGRGAAVSIACLGPGDVPVAGARVRIGFVRWEEPYEETREGWWADPERLGAVAGRDGVARLSGLEPGRRYRLRVDPPRGCADLAAAQLSPWDPADATVRLGASATVTGSVRDRKGRPRPEAELHADLAGGLTRWNVRIRQDGSFAIDGVPPGRVTLRAQIEGRLSDTECVLETVAGAQGVLVVLDPPPTIHVVFETWPKGAFAHAVLAPPEGDEGSLQTIAGGDSLIFRGVAPETPYRLLVGPVGEDALVLRLDGIVAADEPRRARLEKGFEIRGRVLLPPGAADPRVTAGEGAWMAEGEVGDDGRFVVRGLPAGEWDVVATAYVGDAAIENRARAAAGGSVDLDFR